MKKATNPWQLLAQSADREALMVACGVPQAVLEHGSDYDKFHAYAACMPLCQGHAVLARDAELIRGLLGEPVPVCPRSCDYLWHAVAYTLSGQGERPHAPAAIKSEFVPVELTAVPAVKLGKALYAAPTSGLLAHLADAKAVSVEVELSAFVKPNPYAAKQLCQKEQASLDPPELDLLSAQTLRVLGKLCAERGLPLYVHADFRAALPWRALLQYLHGCACLPQVILLAATKEDLHVAAQIVGCVPNAANVPQIRVGLATPDLLDLYQTLLPVGMLPPGEQ